LIGGEGDDTLLGDVGADLLLGGDGADSLDGGGGLDTMAGGAGNDAYAVDDAADRVLETRTGGADTVYASVTWALGPHLEDLVLIGNAAIDGTGNGLRNVITGNDAANRLAGAGGADTLIGGGGDDLYLADAIDVLIEQAGGGHDTVVVAATFALPDHIEVLRFSGTANARGDGNAADNFVQGNVGNNRIFGQAGDDTLVGGAGDDTLHGGDGADSLVGGEGVDRLDGGPGDDTYVVIDADILIELPGAGIDTVLSAIDMVLPVNFEHLTLLGQSGLSATGNAVGNVLTGNGGANMLRGLAGDDSISGGQGADTLEGGLGADTLSGGGASDRFLWSSTAEGGDVVTDFRSGDDLLAVVSAGFGGLAVGMLDAALFANNAPNAATGQFVYTKANGNLAWDEDGTGAAAAVTLAWLTNTPLLSATDIVIVT
jgi:Ca2+-binding RTX toxin-like protein